jgi:homoserine O-acetyltransferase
MTATTVLADPEARPRLPRSRFVPTGLGGSIEGRLTGPAGAPVILVLGGVSAGCNVLDTANAPGWWSAQAGPGKAVDSAVTRILSAEFLGGKPDSFPTTHDQAQALLELANSFGIEQFSVIGASYGGMIALALAAIAPSRITKALVISAADRASAMAQAWRSIQRDTVRLAVANGNGRAGLDLARRLAMTTYRTPEEFDARFHAPNANSRDAKGVAAYLEARGAAYADRVTPERFLALSHSMDAHQVDVTKIACPVTYLAVTEDRLVPVEHIVDAAKRTRNGQYKTVNSIYGHDAFLKEEAAISQAIKQFTGGSQ